MPTYEYECMNCKYRFEEFQNMTDEPLKVCPKCGGKLQRLIGTGSGIIFKGKGFYHTDYKQQGIGDAVEKDKRESKSDSKDKK